MNRREALTAILGTAGVAAAGAEIKEVPAEPEPLFFVLTQHVDSPSFTESGMAILQEAWAREFPGKRLVILPPGADLKAVKVEGTRPATREEIEAAWEQLEASSPLPHGVKPPFGRATIRTALVDGTL